MYCKICLYVVVFEHIKKNSLIPPYCFVFIPQTKVGEKRAERSPNRVKQNLTFMISVVFVLKNVSDVRGEAVADEQERLADELRNLMVGWCPVGFKEMYSAGGHTLGSKNGVMFWMESFKADKKVG